MLLHRILLLLTTTLVGCSVVGSVVPLGQPADAGVAQRLEGVWANADDEVIHVRHLQGNELRMGSIDWNDSAFKLREATVFVGVDDERLYVNLLDPHAPKDKPQYAFARLDFQGDDCITLFLPRADAFAAGVDAGLLSGQAKRNRNMPFITSSSEELANFVDPAKSGEQFDVESVIVFNRVGKVDERKSPEVEVSEGEAR